MVAQRDGVTGQPVGNDQVIAGPSKKCVGQRQAAGKDQGVGAWRPPSVDVVVDGDGAAALCVDIGVVAVVAVPGFRAGAGDEGVVAAIAVENFGTGAADQGVGAAGAVECPVAAGFDRQTSGQAHGGAVAKDQLLHLVITVPVVILVAQRDGVAGHAIGDHQIIAGLHEHCVGQRQAAGKDQGVGARRSPIVDVVVDGDGAAALCVDIGIIAIAGDHGFGASSGDETIIPAVANQRFSS